MSTDFLDTNIIVYANDQADARKQAVAIELVAKGMRKGTAVISTQVMQEYAVNAAWKLKQALPVVMHQLRLLEFLQVVTISPDLVRRALEVSGLYGISYWDALIAAAAEGLDLDGHAGRSLRVLGGVPVDSVLDLHLQLEHVDFHILRGFFRVGA